MYYTFDGDSWIILDPAGDFGTVVIESHGGTLAHRRLVENVAEKIVR